MRTFLKSHPEIDIQLTIDYGLTDVVSERFDAGVRLGGEMDKDMIAIRIEQIYQWLLLAHRIIFLAEVFQRQCHN